uniref:Uncharacterized protein n=1 Tax=Arion vulgaris TaxID=1028688 RepID=A0A0B7AWW5_9EUPU
MDYNLNIEFVPRSTSAGKDSTFVTGSESIQKIFSVKGTYTKAETTCQTKKLLGLTLSTLREKKYKK